MLKLYSGVFAGLLVAAGLWNVPAQGLGHQSHPIIVATDQDAQDYYNYLNAEFYEGKLPDAVVTFVPNLKAPDDNGVMSPAEASTTPTVPIQIRIDEDRRSHPRDAFMSLIHEQCHVATDKFHPEFESHGPAFQKCMLTMAEKGAMASLW